MSAYGLTHKQRKLMVFLQNSIEKSDMVPSYDEMREHVGLKSKSGICRLIDCLVERGYIERLPRRARAIRVVKRVDVGQNMSDVQARCTQCNIVFDARDDAANEVLAAMVDCIDWYSSHPVKGKYARETMQKYMDFINSRRKSACQS